MWYNPKNHVVKPTRTKLEKEGEKGPYKRIINLYVLCDLFFFLYKIVLDCYNKARLVQVVKYHVVRLPKNVNIFVNY